MKGTRQQSEGFTFVELLVVIAIIGILAGLLLPAISTGRGGRCQFNLRQIQMSYAIAVDDNDGHFGSQNELYGLLFGDPRLRYGSALEQFWTHNWGLREYGWLCPSAQLRPNVPSQVDGMDQTSGGLSYATSIRMRDHDGEMVERDFSYTFNSAFDEGGVRAFLGMNGLDENFLKPFISEGDIQHPAQTPIWGDGFEEGALRFANQPPPRTVTPEHAVGIDFALPRHAWKPNGIPPNADFDPKSKLPGATNLSFADGHVEKVPLEKLWSLYWHRDYVPPTKRPGL